MRSVMHMHTYTLKDEGKASLAPRGFKATRSLQMHVLELSAKVYNYYSFLHECVVLGTIAVIIVVVVVLIVLFAIAGFIIQLLAPVIAGIIILIIVVVGGAWLYAKYRSR